MPQRPDEIPAKDAKEELQFSRSEAFVKIYANNVQVETSTWDCRLTFGELTRAEGRNSVEQLASIVMSPQHAKALAGVLVNQLKEYESRFGPIGLEPSDKPASGAAQKPENVKG